MRKKLYVVALVVGVLSGSFYAASALLAKKNSEIYRASSAIFANTLLIQNSEIKDIYLYLMFPSGEAANPFDGGLAHYVEHLAWLSVFGGNDTVRQIHARLSMDNICHIIPCSNFAIIEIIDINFDQPYSDILRKIIIKRMSFYINDL